ncbi:MAG: PD-(D/E)XK nuclease family protein, partial [Muribaculaceae bacterium]|nr:PD-(D/E)XK nuclease family protein [Muribaculaceae bacterium]
TDGYDTIGKDESDTDEHRDVKWNKIKAALDFYTLRHPELSVAEQVAGFLNEESRDNVIAEMLAEMQSVALPALVEAITERFVPVEMRRAQAVFIAGFQDMVLDYTERYAADVASFLSWWESKGVLKSVSSPEGTDAVRIMTVHKAKGLEFKCVIIPLSFSSFTPDTKRSEWRWVRPAVSFAEFDLPPFIPVETRPELLETEHAEEYMAYNDLYMMDRLNSTYVAFTRAVSELYIFARSDAKEGTLSKMLMDFGKTEEDLDELIASGPDSDLLLPADMIEWDEQGGILSVGEKPSSGNKETKETAVDAGKATVRHLDDYMVDSSPKILHYVEEEATDTSTLSPEAADTDPRSEGNLLHAILERVKVASDLHNAVLRLKMRGMLTNAQASEWEPMLEKALADPVASKWFEKGWKVLNERDIIIHNDKNRRPDRVIISPNGKRAIVIDYKFGAVAKDDSHRKQVADYMRLIRQDLHIPDVSGVVWYVREGKFANVRAFN